MVTRQTIIQYDNMRHLYYVGNITLEDWLQYCRKILYEIMDDNRDMLERLKKGEGYENN